MKKPRVITEARREYLRVYQCAAAKFKRLEWVAANGPCATCGSWDRCEVDHVEPSTKVAHRIWSWSLERRTDELRKCQVLCYACHKHKTRIQTYGERQHGTWAMYSGGRCRCVPCKKVNNERRYARRRRREERNRIAAV